MSRAAVREALSALQLAGYIQTRVGDGSYVAVAPQGGDERDVFAGLSIAQTLDARKSIDIAAAYLALRNASAADIERIGTLVRQLEAFVAQGDFKRYLAATLDFHVLVAEAAHSPFLLNLVKGLIERHRPNQWLLDVRYTVETAQHSLRVHRALGDAICDKNVVAALEAVAEHYDHYPLLDAAGHG